MGAAATRFWYKCLGMSSEDGPGVLTPIWAVHNIGSSALSPQLSAETGDLRAAAPTALGISLVVGRLTLDQVAEVRILHPQPLFS